MTNADKCSFIESLISRVKAEVLSKVLDMPAEWDGHELRRYIADKFDESAMTVGRKGPHGKPYAARTRAYRNAVATRNL